MIRLRRLALGLGALVTAILAFAVPGAVADQMPINGMTTLQSTHFRVHFDADYTQSDYLSSARANDVLGFAERAYSTYIGMGYTAPVDDGDGNGLIELWVQSLVAEPFNHYSGFVTPTTPGATTTAGAIHMDVNRGIMADPNDLTAGIDAHAIAHEVFNLFQWNIFHDNRGIPSWMEESSAEWAAFQVANTVSPTPNQLGEADRAIDCIGSQCGYVPSPAIAGYDVFYDRNANTGWSFFQYLSEKYGTDIVKQIWTRAAADGPVVPATQPVDEVLAGKGSSLSAAFNGWITARLNGGFTITGAAGIKPVTFVTIKTGAVAGAIKTQVAAVGHLSARYIQLTPGDGSSNGSCFGGSLALKVAIPAGVTSAPAVFLTSDSAPQALSVSGSTASITIPWSTCTSSPAAYLSLPNATVDPLVNGNEFVVSGTLAVDPTALPTAAPPPPPIKMPGTVVNVPTTDSPPSIDVFGPELIHLAADSRVLRLIVASDGAGKLQAALGSLNLGSVDLRTGHNDVRFTLSAAALSTLRRTAATSGTLTLTPLSAQGVIGQAVVRNVAVEPVATPKASAKPKVKPKVKPKAPAKPKKKTRSRR